MSACFLSESHMVRQFEDTVDNHFGNLFSRTLEFDSENGIADIVLFKKRNNPQDSMDLAKICPRWALTLKKLPYRKYFSIDEFQQFTRSSSREAKKALSTFCNSDFCDQSPRSGKWIKHRQPKLVLQDIVAIEAKLRDWKRALKQARRYLDYANQSWVLLEEKSQKAALKNINHFEQANIGLASISVEGEIQLLQKPKASSPRSDFALWYVNAKIAKSF